jgi:SAM-dependent methyltransferase
MTGTGRGQLRRVFNEVPELYDRLRPAYPDELFSDLVTITGVNERSSVLEVGCGTGQATRSLALLGCAVTAVELGADMAALARQRLAPFPNVEVETRPRPALRCAGGRRVVALGRPVSRLAPSARRARCRGVDGVARQRRRAAAR